MGFFLRKKSNLGLHSFLPLGAAANPKPQKPPRTNFKTIGVSYMFFNSAPAKIHLASIPYTDFVIRPARFRSVPFPGMSRPRNQTQKPLAFPTSFSLGIHRAIFFSLAHRQVDSTILPVAMQPKPQKNQTCLLLYRKR